MRTTATAQAGPTMPSNVAIASVNPDAAATQNVGGREVCEVFNPLQEHRYSGISEVAFSARTIAALAKSAVF